MELKKYFRQRIVRYRAVRDFRGLCYHAIEDKTYQNRTLHNVNLDSFRSQIKSFGSKFSFVSLEELRELYLDNSRHISKVMTLTFDDGFKGIKDIDDIVTKHKIPVTVFLNKLHVTGNLNWREKLRTIIDSMLVDEFLTYLGKNDLGKKLSRINKQNFYYASKTPIFNSKDFDKIITNFLVLKGINSGSENLYLSDSEITKLDTDLYTFGNHSTSHFILSTLSKIEQQEEIGENHSFLQRYPNFRSYFAPPFGGIESVNKNTIDVLKDLRYDILALTNTDAFGSVISEYPEYLNDFFVFNRFSPRNEIY